jgi:hypothetical protein
MPQVTALQVSDRACPATILPETSIVLSLTIPTARRPGFFPSAVPANGVFNLAQRGMKHGSRRG